MSKKKKNTDQTFNQYCLFHIPIVLIQFNSCKIVLQMNLNAFIYGEHKKHRLGAHRPKFLLVPVLCFLSLYPFLNMAAYTCICSSLVRSPAAHLCHGPCFLWPPSTHMPSLFLFENQSYTLFKSQLKLNLLEASRSHSSAVISLPFGPFQSLEFLLCILPLFSVLPGVSLCICLNFPTSLDQCLILSCINNDRQRVSAQ